MNLIGKNTYAMTDESRMSNLISQKIKDELRQLGIEPKKSLGQNFLVNEGIYKKIVAALEIRKNDIIVEAGPGLGTLTGYLAESGAKIIAIEKDRLLIAHLKNKFKNNKNVTIIESDILKFSPATCNLKPVTFKIVGNIPYYITSHLIRNILEDWPSPKLVVLMVQKEVAQRICAKPPEMSLLALSVQYYAIPKIVRYVSGGNFMPSPDVDSAIIKLTPRLQVAGYRLQEKDGNKKPETWPLKPETFFRVVRAGFAGKRKQLINNLSRDLKISKQEIQQKLSSIDINPQRRAETLTIEEWQKITNSLFLRD